MGKNKDLELRIVAKNLASGTIRSVINDLKKLVSSASSGTGGLKTAFGGISGMFSRIGSGLRSAGSAAHSVFSGMVSGAGRVFDAIFSVKTLIMGLFAGIIGKGIGAFIGLNAEFEKMKVSMDVLSKGQGEAWFNKLNQWALDMPVSMSEVSQSFVTLQAYGLTPSIKLMEQLVDVASVLPESGRAITGIARALGQIQTKGRLEGQELRQLAEWGIPAYEAIAKVQKKIAETTGKVAADIEYTSIDSSTAIKAILEAVEDRFGGTAKRISKTWGGLMIRLGNYTKEFFRQIGEGGTMQPFKDQLENIIKFFEKAFKSGEMQKATSFIGSSLNIILEEMIAYFKSSTKDIKSWADVFTSALTGIIYAVTIFMNTLSGIKLVLLGLKFVWVGVAIIINAGLFGIIWLINKIIQGFKFLVDALPSSFPGVSAIQEAFAGLAETTGGIAEAQGENLAILGQMAYTTSEDIANTADTITNRWGAADAVITKLRANLAKYHATEAVPPKTPTVSGGGAPLGLTGYAKEVDDIMKSLTGKQDKSFKPQDDTLQWLAQVGDFTTKAKIGFLEFEAEIDKNVVKKLKNTFKDFFDSIQTGFSTAIQGMLDGSMNLSEGLKSVFDSIKETFFKTVSDMVSNWIVGKTVMLAKHVLFEEATTDVTLGEAIKRVAIKSWEMIKSVAIEAWGTMKIIAMKAYEAAAKVFAALSGMGPWGIVLGVAGAAAAIAIVMGFASKIASFEKGTGLGGVKENGPAMLHAGEIVLNRKESDAFRAGASSGGETSASNNTYTFNISAIDGEDVERIVRKKIIPLLQNNIRDNGRMRTAVKEA